jgi:hypothetical protein
MSELRTKIAAGVTAAALLGLGGLALSHPQAPPPAASVQSAGKPSKQEAVAGVPAMTQRVEHEVVDD